MISPESDDSPVDPDRESFKSKPVDDAAADVSGQNEDPACGNQQEPEPKILEAVDELAVAQQRMLRLQAELENFRKRTRRQVEEERRYCSLTLMRDLLEVVDNLERATSAAEQDESASGLLEGVKMVVTQFKAVLRKYHCEPIEAKGQPFDPNFHEAIANFPSEQYEPGTVSEVHKIGYRLHDRVVRPTQVIVAAPPAQPEPDRHGADDSEA